MHGIDFERYLPPPGQPTLVTLHLPPGWYSQEVFSLRRPRTYLNCVSATQQSARPPKAPLLPFIENGVPVERFESGKRIRKREFAITLGRICPEKGIHLALDASRMAGVPMILAGEVFRYEAHERYFCEQIRPRLDGRRFRFIGPIGFERKKRLLSAAHCLLVPSLAPETSSLVAMEALACGTPVVAFPAGALIEIVEEGKTGYLVQNEREMAVAIHAAGRIDPEICRRAASKRFSSKRMIRHYFDLYEVLVLHQKPDS